MNTHQSINSVDRRSREKAEVHERILNVARDLFVTHGFEAVTMRQIAGAMGYTPGAIYVHFADKRELLLAICRHDFEQFRTMLTALQAHETDPMMRVWLMGRGYLQFARAFPNHYELMFMSKAPSGIEPSQEDISQMGDPNFDSFAFLMQCVSEAIASGQLREELSEAQGVAQMLWAGLHGVATLYITFKDDPWVKLVEYSKACELMQGALLRGIVREPERLERMMSVHPLRSAKMKFSQGSKSSTGGGGHTSSEQFASDIGREPQRGGGQ
jgi:AcrR family transcriptional regulator